MGFVNQQHVAEGLHPVHDGRIVHTHKRGVDIVNRQKRGREADSLVKVAGQAEVVVLTEKVGFGAGLIGKQLVVAQAAHDLRERIGLAASHFKQAVADVAQRRVGPAFGAGKGFFGGILELLRLGSSHARRVGGNNVHKLADAHEAALLVHVVNKRERVERKRLIRCVDEGGAGALKEWLHCLHVVLLQALEIEVEKVDAPVGILHKLAQQVERELRFAGARITRYRQVRVVALGGIVQHYPDGGMGFVQGVAKLQGERPGKVVLGYRLVFVHHGLHCYLFQRFGAALNVLNQKVEARIAAVVRKNLVEPRQAIVNVHFQVARQVEAFLMNAVVLADERHVVRLVAPKQGFFLVFLAPGIEYLGQVQPLAPRNGVGQRNAGNNVFGLALRKHPARQLRHDDFIGLRSSDMKQHGK